MNDQQNNNVIGGMNFIPPTTGNNTSANNNNLNASAQSTDNSIPGANLSPIGGVSSLPGTTQDSNMLGTNSTPQQNIIPPAVPGIVDTTNTVSSDSTMPNNNLLSPNLNAIMPEMSNNSLGNNQPASSGLNLNSSSPFDIGMTPSNDMGNTAIIPNTLGNNSNSSTTGIANNNIASNATTNNNTPLTDSISNNGQANNTDNIVSVGKYLGYMLLVSIPIVGTIMLIVKAFFDKKDINISNLAKAQLLLAVIIFVISLVIGIIFGVIVANNISTITTYGM